MLGAIIGDLAGSIYEYDQIKNHKEINVGNIIEENAFYSDDTILTIAIADAILSHSNYEDKLKEYTLKYENYKPSFAPYFKTTFSPNFIKWAKDETSDSSSGNGAMMRVSPIGYLFNSEEEVIENAYLATVPSHNSESAIRCATTIALMIFYARNGISKDEIKNRLNLNITKPRISKFNCTCDDTIDLCLYSIFKSNSFEDSIKLAISFGGDTDTNACIVGSVAEAFYEIDEELKQSAREKLPSEFNHIIDGFYKSLNQTENIK